MSRPLGGLPTITRSRSVPSAILFDAQTEPPKRACSWFTPISLTSDGPFLRRAQFSAHSHRLCLFAEICSLRTHAERECNAHDAISRSASAPPPINHAFGSARFCEELPLLNIDRRTRPPFSRSVDFGSTMVRSAIIESATTGSLDEPMRLRSLCASSKKQRQCRAPLSNGKLNTNTLLWDTRWGFRLRAHAECLI